MKSAVLALVLTVTAPMHLTFALPGQPVSLPVSWLLIAGELLAAAGGTWLIVRALGRFRSCPYPRPGGAL